MEVLFRGFSRLRTSIWSCVYSCFLLPAKPLSLVHSVMPMQDFIKLGPCLPVPVPLPVSASPAPPIFSSVVAPLRSDTILTAFFWTFFQCYSGITCLVDQVQQWLSELETISTMLQSSTDNHCCTQSFSFHFSACRLALLFHALSHSFTSLPFL